MATPIETGKWWFLFWADKTDTIARGQACLLPYTEHMEALHNPENTVLMYLFTIISLM